MDPAGCAGGGVRRGRGGDVHPTKEKLEPRLPWTADFSAGTVRFIGLAELAGALGLVLPAATGNAPLLTPLAATGLALLMVLAALTHLRRKEPASIAFTAVLFIAAAVVAWERFGPYAL
jgi:VIT1/CCC1 family predicted Fe2+/Mn2+ transporter